MPDVWPLPPDLPWPAFLRLLRRPDPPVGWLEAAADLPEVRRRPLLLRWIAQHRKLPAHLRSRLLPRLPWRALAAIAQDGAAHPQAVAMAVERLQALWPVLSTGERRSLAVMAPRALWEAIWKVPDTGVIQAFLQHPRLVQEFLVRLLQPPLRLAQAEALQSSRWLDAAPVAEALLSALDQSLDRPEPEVVLGLAAPWIKALAPEARLQASTRLTHPALRRMVRTWAIPSSLDVETSDR